MNNVGADDVAGDGERPGADDVGGDEDDERCWWRRTKTANDVGGDKHDDKRPGANKLETNTLII